MSEMCLTYLERPEENEIYNCYEGHYHPYIIHDGWQWHLGRFPSMEKVAEFLKLAGLHINLEEETNCEQGGIYKRWSIDCELDNHNSFKDVKQLPKRAVPFTGLSNGSLVTCYLYNDGTTLHIYRPNPNYKEVYKPLSLEEHIAHCKENGYV